MISRDRLNHTAPERAAQSALAILDHVSDHEPELQPVAMSMAMLAFCRRTGLEMNHLFTVANNILGSKDAGGQAFDALGLYMQHEMPVLSV